MLISGCGGVKVRLVMVMILWSYCGGGGVLARTRVGTLDAEKPVWGGFWFASCLGRGNLNLNHNILIFNDIYGLIFVVEYHLEYRFPKRYFAWDSNLRPSRMLGLSAVRSLS